jgi:hypothetical protein
MMMIIDQWTMVSWRAGSRSYYPETLVIPS